MYCEGDKVLIVNHRTDHMNSHGLMDKWLGKVMTIRLVVEDCWGDVIYYMHEDINEFRGNRFSGWSYIDEDIQGKIIGNKVVR